MNLKKDFEKKFKPLNKNDINCELTKLQNVF